MSVSKDEVRYIAKLSKLNVEDEKLDKMTSDLSSIVEFANNLSTIDIDGVKPTAHILDIKNVFRKDEVSDSYDREEILKNAPESQAGCISVPKVVE
ncbi:aspartyl/glutamyl-tRNA(Asn/Gln) amidotransferase subunit C [Clostridium sp. CAG:921]|nr:aspartyl/glutamyl-tRNA(Asn/Gln) amidotransferase subunit C [Clostridium sp. CAG:921]